MKLNDPFVINVLHPENSLQFLLKKVLSVFIALIIYPQWLQF